MRKLILGAFLLLAIIHCQAVNYFLSGKGDNSFSGQTSQKPWATIERLNKQELQPGDTIFFARNETFFGEIAISQSGSKDNPIVITAYGKGKQPIITGAIPLKNWKAESNDHFATSCSSEVFTLFCNNEMQINARFPNKGWLKMDAGTEIPHSFIDSALTQPDGYWNGATIRYRPLDWEIRSTQVASFKDRTITIAEGFKTFTKGWGYYFDHKFEELDTLKEWYYSKEHQTVYYMPVGKSMAKKQVEAVVLQTGITLAEGVRYVTIENIAFQKFETFGVWATLDNHKIVIRNNSFHDINRTAIDFGLNSSDCLVDGNVIRNVNGRGVTALEPVNMVISQNNITKIGNIPGYGINGVNGMEAIAIENKEDKKTETSTIASNNTIINNFIDSVGYVGIRMDGAFSVMENNVVKNSLYQLSDGSAIYCWATGKYYTHDNVIRNNIVVNVFGNNIGTPNEEHAIANGIYIDNNSYNILIEGNTVVNSTGSGIIINSDAYNNKVLNNKVYNCATGLIICEWLKPRTTFGNIFEGNTSIATDSSQYCVALTNWLLNGTREMGTFDKNIYGSANKAGMMIETYKTEDTKQTFIFKYGFDEWVKTLQYDKQSKAIAFGNQGDRYKTSTIFYNETNADKKFKLKGRNNFTLNGEKIGYLMLKPFTSQIVLIK